MLVFFTKYKHYYSVIFNRKLDELLILFLFEVILQTNKFKNIFTDLNTKQKNHLTTSPIKIFMLGRDVNLPDRPISVEKLRILTLVRNDSWRPRWITLTGPPVFRSLFVYNFL